MLPKMDGFQVCRTLREQGRRPEQGGQGLGIVDASVRCLGQRLGEGQLEGLQELILVQVTPPPHRKQEERYG